MEDIWRLPESIGPTQPVDKRKVWQECRANCSNDRLAKRKDYRKGGFKGYDGGKKIKGRKRYIMVDTQGTLMAGAVTAANLNDQQGLYLLLDTFRFSSVKKIGADMGFQGQEAKGYASCHCKP